jgi:hypothetical protein
MKRWMLLGTALAALGACNSDDPLDPRFGPEAPQNAAAVAEWIVEGWVPGDAPRDPVGNPAVQLSWELPRDWNGEPFRVYSRSGTAGQFLLVATVTSCGAERCLYTDFNVRPGNIYDYYIVAADERRNVEGSPSETVRADVPVVRNPPPPVALSAASRDNGLLLRWSDGGLGQDLWKYQIFLMAIDDSPVFYQVGETDGTGFLDLRAEAGRKYTYRVAALDFDGHVSSLSAPFSGVPAASSINSSASLPGIGSGSAWQRELLLPMVPGGSVELNIVDGRYHRTQR